MAIDLVGRPNNSSEPFLISIPECDLVKDPYCEGNKTMSFLRSAHIGGTSITNIREQINTQTAYLDASCVYGTSKVETDMLRTFVGGKMKEEWNLLRVPLIANPQLSSLNYIFVKEHNRLASQFAENNNDWDDETLFQEARRYIYVLIDFIT